MKFRKILKISTATVYFLYLIILPFISHGSEIIENNKDEKFSVLIAAGDIASCQSNGDEETANLLDKLVEKYPDAVIAPLGDLAYDKGTYQEFINCFHPSWGRHKARMKPAPGNHEWKTDGASGYFGYFDELAGDPNRGYYSYDLGDWHIIVLDSTCDKKDKCSPGSRQVQWLRSDLTKNYREKPTLAYFHYPMFSSGKHGNENFVEKIWPFLRLYGVKLVLSGHDHGYERFHPMDEKGQKNQTGIVQFVIGTGGANLTPFMKKNKEHSIVRNDISYGLLVLKLYKDKYEWEFVPTKNNGFQDKGITTIE